MARGIRHVRKHHVHSGLIYAVLSTYLDRQLMGI